MGADGVGVIRGDVPVWLLVTLRYRLGMFENRIKERFDPPLADADLSAAWAYYAAHRGAVDREADDNWGKPWPPAYKL